MIKFTSVMECIFNKAATCCFIKNTPIADVSLSKLFKYQRTAISTNSSRWLLLFFPDRITMTVKLRPEEVKNMRLYIPKPVLYKVRSLKHKWLGQQFQRVKLYVAIYFSREVFCTWTMKLTSCEVPWGFRNFTNALSINHQQYRWLKIRRSTRKECHLKNCEVNI